jgi:hypothetical protein
MKSFLFVIQLIYTERIFLSVYTNRIKNEKFRIIHSWVITNLSKVFALAHETTPPSLIKKQTAYYKIT